MHTHARTHAQVNVAGRLDTVCFDKTGTRLRTTAPNSYRLRSLQYLQILRVLFNF